ncbi:MAG TPA: precorrin-6y C5,15-methyltransferase (decarboxylating) subunit CbiE, partial [Syntrophomonas sp.]|nr:precorrin-6y C5,15-methyltransferase (decarboxylating) subunit CbiE [Syntrophomonas sp.]
LAEQIKDAPVTALLTGEPWTPRRIAQYLLENNINDLTTAIGQNLSYDDERIIFTSLQKIAEDNNNYDNSIMVIFNER